MFANVEGEDWYKRTIAREKWRSNSFKTFFLVNEGTDVAALESKMPDLLHKYWIDMERYPQYYAFESLKEIHLQANHNFDIGVKGKSWPALAFHDHRSVDIDPGCSQLYQSCSCSLFESI